MRTTQKTMSSASLLYTHAAESGMALPLPLSPSPQAITSEVVQTGDTKGWLRSLLAAGEGSFMPRLGTQMTSELVSNDPSTKTRARPLQRAQGIAWALFP